MNNKTNKVIKSNKIRVLQEIEKKHIAAGVCNCYCNMDVGSKLLHWGMTRNSRECEAVCRSEFEHVQGMARCSTVFDPIAIGIYLIAPVPNKFWAASSKMK